MPAFTARCLGPTLVGFPARTILTRSQALAFVLGAELARL